MKSFIDEWKSYGRVPFNKKNINVKFNTILDAIFKKLDVSKQESELMKYGDKLKKLANIVALYTRHYNARQISQTRAEG